MTKRILILIVEPIHTLLLWQFQFHIVCRVAKGVVRFKYPLRCFKVDLHPPAARRATEHLPSVSPSEGAAGGRGGEFSSESPTYAWRIQTLWYSSKAW